jgi:hypothetical protein
VADHPRPGGRRGHHLPDHPVLEEADELADRIALSAIGSITWNTETLSAFLLVGVGLVWAILSVRLLKSPAGVQPSS